MNRREKIQADIDELQERLAKLDRIPEDKFNLGDILIISTSTTRTYIVKTAEERWSNIKTGAQQDLAGFILDFENSPLGYFEVYSVTVASKPIYTKV